MFTLTPTSVALFAALVSSFLWLDLRHHRSDRPVSLGNAAAWSAIWVLLALVFAGFVAHQYGSRHAFLFLAGYALEESLSIDNLFVFMAVFASFSIRDAYQHRVLYYGILGAVVMRLLFIVAGRR